MVSWIGLAVVAAIVTVGTAASLRYGLWGRRVTAGLVVLFVVATNTPRLGERGAGNEAHMITTLRALNAAQLLYSTTEGGGSYARTLDDLNKYGIRELVSPEATARRGYRIELISSDASYAVIAVPIPNPRVKKPGPTRAFCVGPRGSIYQTLNGQIPAVVQGRCRDTSKPIQ